MDSSGSDFECQLPIREGSAASWLVSGWSGGVKELSTIRRPPTASNKSRSKKKPQMFDSIGLHGSLSSAGFEAILPIYWSSNPQWARVKTLSVFHWLGRVCSLGAILKGLLNREKSMQRNLALLAQEKYDLVIVGGGIFGIAAAWDAGFPGLAGSPH